MEVCINVSIPETLWTCVCAVANKWYTSCKSLVLWPIINSRCAHQENSLDSSIKSHAPLPNKTYCHFANQNFYIVFPFFPFNLIMIRYSVWISNMTDYWHPGILQGFNCILYFNCNLYIDSSLDSFTCYSDCWHTLPKWRHLIFFLQGFTLLLLLSHLYLISNLIDIIFLCINHYKSV